jgi:hypothetical protein
VVENFENCCRIEVFFQKNFSNLKIDERVTGLDVKECNSCALEEEDKEKEF